MLCLLMVLLLWCRQLLCMLFLLLMRAHMRLLLLHACCNL